jgi:hypothetical protein
MRNPYADDVSVWRLGLGLASPLGLAYWIVAAALWLLARRRLPDQRLVARREQPWLGEAPDVDLPALPADHAHS